MSAASATRSIARCARCRRCRSPGEAATLSIETYVREDVIRLYGFATDLEREWFRLLQTVQGVGSKVALAVLGIMKPGELATAIALQDKALLARAPGVGKKVAERIVAELRDKAPAYASADPAVIHLQADLAERRAPQPVADAVSALVNLGYAQIQASAAVAAASRAGGEDADHRAADPPWPQGTGAVSTGSVPCRRPHRRVARAGRPAPHLRAGLRGRRVVRASVALLRHRGGWLAISVVADDLPVVADLRRPQFAAGRVPSAARWSVSSPERLAEAGRRRRRLHPSVAAMTIGAFALARPWR